MMHLLQIAIEAAIKGGEEIIKVYSGDFEVEHKNDMSPITQADKNSHKTIADKLASSNLPILSEEGTQHSYQERKNWSKFWLIDPLDGTAEFVKRNGQFTVNIALIEKQNPIMGVVYQPVDDILYFALEQIGAFKLDGAKNFDTNNLEELLNSSQKLPITTKREKYVILDSVSHKSERMKLYVEDKRLTYPDLEIREIGSSVKLCLLAEGKADEYPRFGPTMEWDIAAGHAILINSNGGVFELENNNSLIYNKENLLNPHFIARKF